MAINFGSPTSILNPEGNVQPPLSIPGSDFLKVPKTSKTSTGSVNSKVSPQEKYTVNNGLSDLLDSFKSSMQSSASSAMEAEKTAAADANDFTEKMWQKAAEYNTERDDIAYQRSITAAEKANEFSRSERLASQQWYENMSNTAYQRAMADMEKAGLNPILAYAQGGASSAMSSASSGAMANVGHPSMTSSSGVKASMASAKGADSRLASAYLSILGDMALQGLETTTSALKYLWDIGPGVAYKSADQIRGIAANILSFGKGAPSFIGAQDRDIKHLQEELAEAQRRKQKRERYKKGTTTWD